MDIALIIIFILAYLAPWLLAKMRQTRNSGQVFMVTVFFGWTFIGWAIAFVMAMSNNVEE